MVGWSPDNFLKKKTNGHLADTRRDDKNVCVFVNSIIALRIWKINRKLFYKD